MKIYGGFAGNETVLTQRDWTTNLTIFSGDIQHDDLNTDGNNIAETYNDKVGTNSSIIVKAEVTSGTSISGLCELNGFYVTAGHGDGAGLNCHTSVAGKESSPSIFNCRFLGNFAINGGAVKILANQGGGTCNPEFVSCNFSGNKATYGGAIHNTTNVPNGICNPTLINCSFSNNDGVTSGVINNSATSGTVDATLINCSFAANISLIGPAINNSAGNLIITNCIFWDAATIAGDEISHSNGGTAAISYCDIQGSNGSGGSWLAALGTDGGSNIDVDPMFVCTGDPACLITGISPCADAGNNSAISESYDIRGPNYGRKLSKTDGSAGDIDMGAYEYQYDIDPVASISWTAGASTSAWETTTNWQGDIVPLGTYDVCIPVTATDPLLASGIAADCNDMNVNDGASLTVESGGSLITNGTITNNGTINMNLSVDDGEWHLISIPTTGITANIFLLDYLQNWDETVPGWDDIIEPATPLNTNFGYALWTTGSKSDYTYTGTPLTGLQSAAITLSSNFPNPAEGNDGANLLGNPYPSSIDWSGLDDTWGAVYYWDPAANAGAGDYVEWNSGAGSGSQYIPPMQGFFIVADESNTTAGTGTFELTNNDRTHSGATSFYKSKIQNGIVLLARSGESTDELFIRFDAETSPGFDLRNDALKFVSGADGVSQLYAYGQDYKLAIDTRPETETIQLGFENETGGIYSISAKEMDGITKALLEDTKTGSFHELSPDSYRDDYEFVWEVTDDEKRFKLHLNAVGIEENQISESNILIYAADQQIFIKGAENGNVMISDVMGRIVLEQNISGSDMTTIPVNLEAGVYVVMVSSGACSTIVPQLKTEKVFIKYIIQL